MLAVALVWISGSAVAVFATTQRPRRVVVSTAAFAGLSVVLLALFTVFGPTIGAAAAGGGHHLPVAPGDAAAVSVADLRETREGEVHRFELEARHQTITLPDGSDYDAVTFGSVPGPELVVTQGELVEVTLTNRDVAGGVTLHWHGYDVPAGDDGVAGVTQDAVRPGETFVYRFVADEVGTYWYHTHQDALEGIVRGLYGALVVLPRRRAGTRRHRPHPHDERRDPSRRTDVLAGPGRRAGAAAPRQHRPGSAAHRARRRQPGSSRSTVPIWPSPLLLPAGTVLRIPAGGRADLLVDGSARPHPARGTRRRCGDRRSAAGPSPPS